LPAYKPLGSINARKIVRRFAGNAVKRVGEFLPQSLGDVAGMVADPTGATRLAISIGGSLGRGDVSGAAGQVGGLVHGAADPFINLATAPLAALPESSTLGQVGRESGQNIMQHGGVDEALAIGSLFAPKFMPRRSGAALAETPRPPMNAVEASVMQNEVLGQPQRLARRTGGRQLTQAEWAQQDPLMAALSSGEGIKSAALAPVEDIIGAAKARNAALREAAGEAPRPRTPAAPKASLEKPAAAATERSLPAHRQMLADYETGRGATRENLPQIMADRKANPLTTTISEQQGVSYDGVGELGKTKFHQFTDPVTHDTFNIIGKPTPQKIYDRLTEKRAAAGYPEPYAPRGVEAPPSTIPTSMKGAEARAANQMEKIRRQNIRASGETPTMPQQLPADILDLLRPKE